MRVLILLCLIAYVQSNLCDEVDNGVFNWNDGTSIGQNAFSGCTDLVTFIGNDVTEIGQYAFYGCTKLQTFTGSNVQTIYGGAFQDSGLQHFNFANV